MSALSQKTVNNSLSIKGIGLHTGEPVNIKINPAEPNTGIVFKRTDLNNNNYIIPSMCLMLPIQVFVQRYQMNLE